MKTSTLTQILSTQLSQGADISFFSTYYQGFCTLQKISGEIIVTCLYDPWDLLSRSIIHGECVVSISGECFVINNLYSWVSANKKDIEAVLRTGCML